MPAWMQCRPAILSVKLPYLNGWNGLRVRSRQTLRSRLCRIEGDGSRRFPPTVQHNFHLFVVRVAGRDALKDHLQKAGIQTGIHYPVPLHLTDAYQALGYPNAGSMPVTEKLAGEILSLPMYPELGEEQIDYVVRTVLEFIN